MSIKSIGILPLGRIIGVAVVAAVGSVVGIVLNGTVAGSADSTSTEKSYHEGVPANSGSIVATDDDFTRVEAAIQDYIACGEAAGFKARPFAGEGLRHTRPYFDIPSPSGKPEQSTVQSAEEILGLCRSRYLSTIPLAQDEPTREQLEIVYTELKSCVMSGGRPGTAVPQFTEYGVYANASESGITVSKDDLLAYHQCAIALEAEHGLMAPPPIVQP